MVLRRSLPLVLVGMLLLASSGAAWAAGRTSPPHVQLQPANPAAGNQPGTGITYQGELKLGANLVNATCALQFSLFDASSGGHQLGGTQTVSAVSVAAGRFTVTLNAGGQFGLSAFDGDARWLAIAVKCPPDGSFTPLLPRQPLTPAPLALALPGLRTEQLGETGLLGETVNVIGGSISNTVASGLFGDVIAGGGDSQDANMIIGTQADDAAIGGGAANEVSGYADTIGGGVVNTAGGNESTIGGGIGNTASLSGTVVAGGIYNLASGEGSAIGGGAGNAVTGTLATVGGGQGNIALGLGAVVGGGESNMAGSEVSTIGGGGGNQAGGAAATIGGGIGNQASGDFAAIAGGSQNTASGAGAFVGGGGWDGVNHGGNTAAGALSTIGGGFGNTATVAATYSTIGGGITNTASNVNAVVAGGKLNTASGPGAAIGGGFDNTAGGINAVVAGGQQNSAGGTYASVPGGLYNSAGGDYSFAAGDNAHAGQTGDFVWADATGNSLTASGPNQFLVRASGGITFTTNISATSGAVLASGSGSWSILSDRNMKANFDAVDGLQVLNALAGIPIQTWNYKTQAASIRHMGPMAQDFQAAFGVGENNTTISTVDAQGVALAAIQGLYQLVQQKDAQITTLSDASANQQAQIRSLSARVTALEAAAPPASPPPAAGGLALPWLLLIGLGLLNVGGVAGYLLRMARHA